MNSSFESISTSSFRVFALGCALLVFGPSTAFAAAGKIQFTAGEVKIVNAQKAEREAKKGEALETGDTIVTGASGSVQVALADGGLIAVRPNSQLKIDDYAYSGKADDSQNKSFFSLGKGTFRSITGAIGQNNKQAYRVNTPTATMGIRGTDHEPAVVLPLPPLPPDLQALTPLQLAPPGTYDRVNSGETFIQNSEGLVFLGPNQVGFAPAGGGSPIALPQIPGFYTNTPKTNPAKAAADVKKSASASGGASGTATSSGGDSSGSSTSTSKSTTSSSSESTVTTFGGDSVSTFPSSTDTSLSTSQTVTTDTTLATASGTGATGTGTTTTPPPPPPSGSLALIGSGLVGAVFDGNPSLSSSGSIALSDSASQAILLGAQNEVLAIFDGLTMPTFEFDSNNSALIDQGSITFSDNARVDWGRWIPGFLIIEDGVTIPTIGDFHYVFSQDITSRDLVTSGTLTGGVYGYVGGTRPTDLNGVAGDIIRATTFLNVDFGQQTVTFNVSTLINGVSLSGSAFGSIPNFITPDVGIGPSTGDTVNASGFFVGTTASGAITSFDITNAAGTSGAIGTAVFARPPAQ